LIYKKDFMVFDLFRLRKKHGRQFIPNIRKARLKKPFRGFPFLAGFQCGSDCRICTDVCPTSAISASPLTLDLGACIFCGDCARACPSGAVHFTPEYRLASTNRTRLILESEQSATDYQKTAITVRREIRSHFGRSIKLRQVSAGGCSGCELELAASNNVNFDMGRFGIDFVASPRHADGLVITGPVTANMAPALRDTWESMSDPRIVIAVGACAISGGLFASSDVTERDFFKDVPVGLFVPGCPPHPLTIIHAILDFLGR
jgi:Ni,Fe-hydrogenase III small subunit/NAD-dependent dihydropyrimidine dehydrogenase PreA subunit